MERLVQLADLEKYPQLVSQGVSVNMLYDFDALEPANEVPPVAQKINEPTLVINKPKTKKKKTTPIQKNIPKKQTAKRK